MRNAELTAPASSPERDPVDRTWYCHSAFRILHSAFRRGGDEWRHLARPRHRDRDRERRRRSAAGGTERGTRAGCASSRRRDHSPRRLRPQPAEHSAGGSRGGRGGRWARKLHRAPDRLGGGDGAVRYAEAVTRWIGTAPVPLESLPPAATMLLALVDREGTGRAIEDPVTAEPVYGRPAEAQARWEARHGRPLPDSPRPAG